MTFVEFLNNNILQLIFLLGLFYLIAIRRGLRQGGRQHQAYIWTLWIFAIYTLITPSFMFFSGVRSVINTDISGYFGLHFFFSCMLVFFFYIGYWAVPVSRPVLWEMPSAKALQHPEKTITRVFLGTYGIVMVNMAVGGINIANVVLGNEVVGQGARGASYYLQNFADSLISVIVLAYLYGLPRKKLLLFIGTSFFLFFLLGFRYRILLAVGGLFLGYLLKHELTRKQIIQGLVIGLFGFYMLVFSTINRFQLVERKYDEIVLNPLKFPVEGYFEQTRGALADMAIYRLFDNPAKEAKHDNGLTMFAYVFIRMIPRTIMPNKDDFYPPPQLQTTYDAYDPWWGKFTGEATLSTGGIYIAWGWLGIVFAHFFWGVLLRRFSGKVVQADPLSTGVSIVVCLATFQWISRGYFPQTVDHFAYLMFPLWILRFIRNKQHADN